MFKHKLTTLRKITWILLSMIIVINFTFPVSASSSKINTKIRNLLYYYQYYQDDAQVDIDRLLSEMAAYDPDQAEKWGRIMDFWSWTNREMEKIPDVLPDGLPEDDSLCIVVLGYGLEGNGEMKPELLGRLQTALNCAEKYPNAYVLCSGGGARGDFTEAGQMSKWLMEQGVAEERIIVECTSNNTSKNARYSCRILREEYPQIRSLALVTSDYHIRRGYLVFFTESVLTDAGLEIVGNAVYVANRDVTETYTYQAYEISRLVPVGYQENAPRPALSKVKEIAAECQGTWAAGEDLQLTVTAHYTNGYTRDVTGEVVCTGVDFYVSGMQTMTVSYTERGITYTTQVEIDILTPETLPAPEETIPEPAPTQMVTVPTETIPVAEEESRSVSDFPVIPVVAVLGAAMLLVVWFGSRKVKSSK